MHVISRAFFISAVGNYTKGTHLDEKRLSKAFVYRRARKVEVSSDVPLAYTLDGEVLFSNSFTAEVIPYALRLSLPGT